MAAACTIAVLEVGLRLAAPSLRYPQVWELQEANQKHHQMSDLAEEGGAGTVFIGSSLVGVGLDPAHYADAADLDRPAYNAALLSSALGQQSTWLEHFVVPMLEPDTVVIGVSARELNANDPTLDDADRLFAQAGPVREARDELSLAESAEQALRRTSYLFRYREVLREPLQLFDDDPLPRETAVTDLGMTTAVLDRDFAPFDRELLARFGHIQRFALADHRLDQLATTARTLVADGIAVVLVDMPVTQAAIDVLPRGRADYEQTSTAVQQLAGEVGATYVPTGVWGTDVFADEWHVNGRGAERLTTLLAGAIA